jgi:hypothetical protein
MLCWQPIASHYKSRGKSAWITSSTTAVNFAAVDRTGLNYCTALARSRAYSSLEMVPEFFRRSSFSSSSATL